MLQTKLPNQSEETGESQKKKVKRPEIVEVSFAGNNKLESRNGNWSLPHHCLNTCSSECTKSNKNNLQ